MAYAGEYRRHGGRRPRRGYGRYYGWGVPIRGMYSYSLDYGNLGGPEWESETIPPYPTPEPPYVETRHWSAAEPAFEPRYEEEWLGPGAPFRPGRGRRVGWGAGPWSAHRGWWSRGYDRAYGRRSPWARRGAGYARGWEWDRGFGVWTRGGRDVGGAWRSRGAARRGPAGDYAWDYW
ncbi:MAG: hypothetical protein IRZ00_11370 [Gemmatimonadetes bacterium]|nr:hypothetical protein [Gemmatimonadota bacterium]